MPAGVSDSDERGASLPEPAASSGARGTNDSEALVFFGATGGRRRMTMTYSRLARAGASSRLVTGSEKRAALARLLAGDPSIPASGVTAAEQVLFCDTEAVGDRGAPRVATEGN